MRPQLEAGRLASPEGVVRVGAQGAAAILERTDELLAMNRAERRAKRVRMPRAEIEAARKAALAVLAAEGCE